MPISVVTGAGTGIGRAIAIALAEAGHHVVLAGRTPSPLEATADQIRALGMQALIVPTDVTKPDHVDALIARTLDVFGGIDVLVNNAGQAHLVPTCDLSTTQWHEILDTNLSAAFYATRAAWPHMQRQHLEFVSDHRADTPGPRPNAGATFTGGAIINISSMSSRDPFPGLGAYGVAKAGLNMLTLVTAREGEPNGIGVLGIAPGAVETSMFRGLFTREQVPADDVLSPTDIAAMVMQFVSPGGALRRLSGETIFPHRRM